MEKKTLKLTVDIDAPKEKVWDVLLADETYRKWTSVFHPGSYAETDWQEGSKVLFGTPEGHGLVSKVLLNRPYEVISFEHRGLLKNGLEEYDNEEVKMWQGFKETYYLAEAEGGTRLTIEQDISNKEAEWFNNTWKEALQKVKELSETTSLQLQ